MELSNNKQYTITPRTSKLYYIMLDRIFINYNFDFDVSEYRETLYCSFAEKLSWWFSRLLRLQDNDLKEHKSFYYVEFLYLCDKISSITMEDYTGEEMDRFKELVPKVKEYVRLKLIN
jgi:hypothetical protein